MRQRARNLRLIGWTLLLEAWRRREVYAIVLVTTALLIGLRFVRFFEMEGLGKFYREISLKVMNVTTAATVILLAARQLPREFSDRTIYPLLAKPVSRLEFLLGKFLGVMGAGVFCYALFMAVFLVGSVTLEAPMNMALFAQSVYLQVLSLGVLASLVFLLSMLLNADAAVTIAAILYLTSQVFMTLMSYLYDYVSRTGRWALLAMHFIVPQLTLFDPSAKTVHSVSRTVVGDAIEQTVVWRALPAGTLLQLTVYAAAYAILYLGAAHLLFRRKPL